MNHSTVLFISVTAAAIILVGLCIWIFRKSPPVGSLGASSGPPVAPGLIAKIKAILLRF